MFVGWLDGNRTKTSAVYTHIFKKCIILHRFTYLPFENQQNEASQSRVFRMVVVKLDFISIGPEVVFVAFYISNDFVVGRRATYTNLPFNACLNRATWNDFRVLYISTKTTERRQQNIWRFLMQKRLWSMIKRRDMEKRLGNIFCSRSSYTRICIRLKTKRLNALTAYWSNRK